MAEAVIQAEGVAVGYSTDGDLHVEFLDANRAPFARASMSREVFATFMGKCADAADAVSLGGLALMKEGGSA